MPTTVSSYRPHDAGHDYHAPGIYLITLVIRNRDQQPTLLGHLNDSLHEPDVVLSDIGQAVMECWHRIPEMQRQHNRVVQLHAAVCMPDHFHGVIEVLHDMDVSVGDVICGFKTGCTQAWRHLQPYTVADAVCQPANGSCVSDLKPYMDSNMPDLHRMSRKQRAEYYAANPTVHQPLWDDNYDDTICLTEPETICLTEPETRGDGNRYNQRHLDAMLRYVADNPRRAIIRRQRPQFMQRCLHLRIAGREYGAFGNLFLLRWARKVQVFCHRKAPDGTPYEQSEAYRQDCIRWKTMVMQGQTVIVTPGISKGELNIKNRCLECHYPLIHLQKDAIGRYWKPEKSRFEACVNGSLLILAPWQADSLGDFRDVPSGTDYSIFHNLNGLAAEICAFDGDAVVVGEG